MIILDLLCSTDFQEWYVLVYMCVSMFVYMRMYVSIVYVYGAGDGWVVRHWHEDEKEVGSTLVVSPLFLIAEEMQSLR